MICNLSIYPSGRANRFALGLPSNGVRFTYKVNLTLFLCSHRAGQRGVCRSDRYHVFLSIGKDLTVRSGPNRFTHRINQGDVHDAYLSYLNKDLDGLRCGASGQSRPGNIA